MINVEQRIRVFSDVIGKPVLKWDRSDYIAFLEGVVGFDKGYFYKINASVYSYLRAEYGDAANSTIQLFESVTYSDVDIAEKIQSNYFFSLMDVYRTTRKHVGIVHGEENQEAHLPIPGLMICGWYRLRLEDALAIKNSDINDDGDITINGKLITLPFTARDVMLKLRDMKFFYTVTSNGKTMKYELKDSPYLFRTYRTDVMTKESASVIIKEINAKEAYEVTGKKIAFEKVAISGIFYSAVREEMKDGDTYRISGNNRLIFIDKERAERIFCSNPFITTGMLKNILRVYDIYKRIAIPYM